MIGLDEHTACTLDLRSQEATVAGLGSVTVRWAGAEAVFESGARFPFSVLRGQAPDAGVVRPSGGNAGAGREADAFVLDRGPRSRERLQGGPGRAPGPAGGRRAARSGPGDLGADESAENSELVSQARELQAELLVLLGSHVESLPRSREECLEPLVSALLDLRDQLRREGRWADGDAIRETLARAHVIVEDTRDGPRWEIR